MTEQFGLQKCPVCNADVSIKDPSAGPDPAAPAEPARTGEPPRPPPPRPDAAVDASGATAWDRRDALGLFEGLKRTVVALLTDPADFFTRIREGAAEHLSSTLMWFVVTGILPSAIAGAVSVLTTDFAEQYAQLREAYGTLGLPFDETGQLKAVFDLMDQPAAAPAVFLGQFVLLPVVLYVLAGLTHLSLAMTGGVKRRFDATLRGVAYSFTPSLLMLVPVCGNLAGFAWVVALQYISVHRIHDTGAGRTVVSAFVLPFVLLMCLSAVLGVVGGIVVGVAAAGG